MKILFLCHKMPFPPNDGGAIATLNMIKGFAEKGDELTVLTMQTHKHFSSIADLPNELTTQISWHQIWVNTKLNPLKAIFNLLFSRMPYIAQRFKSQKYKNKLIQILSNQTFDIIQLEGLYVSSYISKIREHSSALISYRAHNVEHEIWNRLAVKEPSRIKRFYYNLLASRIKEMELKITEKIDLLIPISAKDADFFKIKEPNFCKVSPTGMVATKFKLTQPSELNAIFFIGSLDWMPNQEGLLWFIKNVWVPLYSKYPQWKFIIAGRKAPVNFVKKLVQFPIVFAGEVNDSTEFIDKYQLMVVPLISGSGMRIKIVEAMARGKCILTTSKGAEGIDAQNLNEIVIADNSVLMTEYLEKLFQNPNLIKDYGENAFKFASNNFKNEILINGLRNFYQHKLLAINDLS